MHTTRSPSSISAIPPGDALDLSLSGSQLSISKRPSSASPGKYFSRSVSVSVACEGRGKRNTVSDAFGSSRSIKNLRRSNSTTQVNQQAHATLSQDQSGDYLTLLDSGANSPKKLGGLGKASPDRTTWNILDDQPRAPTLLSSARSSASADSPTSLKRRDPVASLGATFTANNRSNKGAVGNSVTTILHNNHAEKPLTPKSSNQRPAFNNILKATANDGVSLESSSLTKSQKNFSSTSSNNKSPAPQRGSPVLPRRKEVTEEEAERFIQQVNQSAVTIQRWYRRHARRRRANQAALRHVLASKRKEWQERAEAEGHLEQPRDDRKQIREEKARQARLAAIQELQQKRAQQRVTEADVENGGPSGAEGRRKPAKIYPSNRGPNSPANIGPMSPTDVKANNTDFHLSVVSDFSEVGFRTVSPVLSNHRVSPCFQELDAAAEEDVGVEQHQGNDRKLTRQAKAHLSRLAVTRSSACDELQQAAETELENRRPTGSKKILLSNRGPSSPRNISPMSAIDVKAKNTDSNLNVPADFVDFSCFRAVSPPSSNHRGSQCSQELPVRSLGGEDQRQAASSSMASKSTLNDLLDTLKLLEAEPERLSQPKCYSKEKYAWTDEDGDGNSLTADNLERHGQLSLPPSDGAALLSEAKLQSIMSFLDEMEKSEQERPRSATSGSQREAVFMEEELAGMDQASATAAEVSGSIMRIKMELEEKKRVVLMLQNALAQQRELTVQHVKETEKELSRNLQLQRDQYEATVQRHLAFIDQLISDKKALSERCEGVLAELKQVDHKYTKKISQMQEQHEMEIKKLKELMSVTEKIRREKWIDEKTKKIKEITVKGLEPEIQKLISKHKLELKKLRALHEAELLQAEQQGAQNCARQCEGLRQQLEKEKEEQCQKERVLAKQSLEKQLHEEEISLQQHRRRLHKEVAEEKERLAQLAARQHWEMDELRRQMEENASAAGRLLKEELDKTREEQERRHQAEMKTLQEHFQQDKMNWEEEFSKKQEAGLLRRERELREELRRERDKEIELAIWTLEEETNKDKEESERVAENRVKRVRETYEVELKELERSLRAAAEKQQEMRRQHSETEEQLMRAQELLSQKEEELENVTQSRDQMLAERRGLTEVIRQEFAERLRAAEDEKRRLNVEVSEARARLQQEVERVTKEKEAELDEVHQRVRSAILKKEEAVSALRRQHEAALKRAEHLEALWEEQRRQLLAPLLPP
ncbi:centrosomal protein of 131 kDa isoform X2 [Dunckerocampus dactyliophorus]|uniref:centrosomal protein of 131 kDa isoform X2 n=1 Tax=Dunckerocampus dactyliophorus TaxID=161453 RepID=UPI002404D807|nr:centrosomal protein of 131 kDa isoform X2 [Dunckerocampus dactyliophorus]